VRARAVELHSKHMDEATYARYRKRGIRRAARLGARDPEDVFQEAVLATLRAGDRVDDPVKHLYGAMRHIAIGEWWRRLPELPLLTAAGVAEPPSHSIPDWVERRQQLRIVAQAARNLSASDQDLVTRHVEDQTPKEIAAATGLTAKQASQRTWRAESELIAYARKLAA
jgi:DNA-directed RNA polymerase specialized sigma24 family protein